jgi:peptide/nickel transport system substrate-binding protein
MAHLRPVLRALGIASFAMSLFLASCISLATQPAFAAPETMIVGMTGDFPTLDPSKDSSPLGSNYRLNVFNALTAVQRDGSISPRLAVSWTSSADLTQWTFALRKGVKFHDGSDFVAADVKFTYDRILADGTSPVRSFARLVKSVEVIDDFTVKFTLVQPYAIFDRQATFIYIMSKAYFDKVGDQGYATKPVGTGPYRLVEWVKADRMVLEANAAYWAGVPQVKKAIFRPVPAEASRANALLTGEVDLVPELSPPLMAMFRSSATVRIGVAPGFRVVYFAVDPNRAPFDNPLVREAIDIAVDRKSITEKLLRGVGTPTGMMLPPAAVGYDPSFKAVAFDPERARALLKQAGYAGEPIKIDYPNNNFAMANEVVQAVAGYLTAVGLKVTIAPMEFTAFFPLWLQPAKLDNSYLFAYGSSQYHAEGVLSIIYEQGGDSYRADPEIDRLTKQQRGEKDPAKQKALIVEAFRRSNELRYYIPLYDLPQVYGVKKSIDFTPFPDGVVRFYEIK